MKKIVAAIMIMAITAGLSYAQVININTATIAELSLILGILPTDAQKIVMYRKRHGGYRTLKDLYEVPGLSEEVISQLMEDAMVVAE